MIIGVLSVKNHRYHPNRRLIEAAKKLNHRAVLIHPKKIFPGLNSGSVGLNFSGNPFSVDVLVPRLGASIKDYSLAVIRQFQSIGVPVINRFESIILVRNKFFALQSLSKKGVPIPETRYVSNPANFEKAVADLGGLPVVVKMPSSRQGRGVFLVKTPEESLALLDGILDKGAGLMIQEFIPTEKRRDMRIVVVGDKAVAAMSLTPKRGEFRANIHLNAGAEKLKLSKNTAQLAVRATKSLGLDISGVDMIENEKGDLKIIEVNYTPGFRGLEKCTGQDVAGAIIKFVADKKRRKICK